MLKVWANTHGLTPMPQPITTIYASLTTDKLPSSQTLVPSSKSSLHFAAALKSVQILSKFWGDEVDGEMEDTHIPDKRLEVENCAEAFLSDFEQHYPSVYESTKAERKKKKQMNKLKPTSFNSKVC